MKKIPVLLLVVMFASIGAFAQTGTIKSMNGTVELKAAGALGFTPAKTGDSVAQNTVVSTGFKSTAIITAGSATIIVRPLTRLTLAEISAIQETEKINVHLQAGRVQVEVKPPSGSKANFAIQSPTATASVRGTAFDFDTHNLLVREGTVAFTSASGSTMLIPAGMGSRVKGEGSRPSDPVETLETDLLPMLPAGAASVPPKESLPAASAQFGIDLGF